MQKIEPIIGGSPEAQSADLKTENIATLKALFPELLTERIVDGKAETAINVDVLKQLVGDTTASDAEEKYGLNWHGKRRARQIALTPSTGTLRPCPEESVDWNTTQNLMIEGDNLEVLKLLQKSYAGKVKLIYIDPPYNTGKDFVYPDNFQDNIKNYLELTGQVEDGAKLTSNTEASGRFHSDWLSMMYPRLKLARGLVSDDGVICISIADMELANLKHVCEDVFGSESYKGTIVRTTGQTTGQDSGGLGSSFDYMLLYSKNADIELSGLPLDDSDLERYQDSDARGRYALWQLRKSGSNDRRTDRPNMFFAIQDPDGNDVHPIGPTGYESRWRFDPKGYARLKSEDFIVWKKRPRPGSGEEWWPYVKTYLEGRTKRASPLWADLPGSKKASIDLRALMNEDVFDNPKPVDLILRILQILPGGGEAPLVLDFFAGSGTTAQAVLAANAADGGNRRYILIQLPEPLDPENKDQKTAADFCEKLGNPRTIAELTKERLRRAAAKVKADNPMFSGDTGFRVFKLDTSNIRAWSPDRDDLEGSLLANIEHIQPGRSDTDVLYELLLKLGLDLCVPIEARQIAGKSVHSIAGGVLMACLEPRIAVTEAEALALGMADWRKEQAPAGETTAVFRDSAFENDVAKSNLAAILEQHGVAQVRSL
ncbi:MAG: site-specific DNA-methyltransferase [Sterolibacterium sp.]|nr:site-specific DNA-methyltransferase [Sterolibacterium sp.]